MANKDFDIKSMPEYIKGMEDLKKYDKLMSILKKGPEKPDLNSIDLYPKFLQGIRIEREIKDEDERRRLEEQQRKQQQKIKSKSIGKEKTTKKRNLKVRFKKLMDNAKITAIIAALIASGVFIGYKILPPIIDRLNFYNDVDKALEIVTKRAEDNLKQLNLGYTNEDGKFVIYDNKASDYAKLGLIDSAPTEVRAYLEAIGDEKEYNDFFQGLRYTEGGLEREFINGAQYLRITGCFDQATNTPSSTVFYNITEAQLASAYNDGTIYEIVQDLTETQSKGGR